MENAVLPLSLFQIFKKIEQLKAEAQHFPKTSILSSC
jgi:hypothetical protein